MSTDAIGQYTVVRELGEGQFGTVYLAEGELPRTRRRTQVAIKRLIDPAKRGALDGLRREFKLLEQARHRSICKVYEFLDAEAAVVMEYVHGRTLREVLDGLDEASESFPVEAAIEVALELADCLYQAHSALGPKGNPLQLVHRDLKPENVMLTPTGEVKVLDFGLASVHDPERGRDLGKGTPLYMAPEQALGRTVDHRTDLFAVGLVLYEMLAGRPAYEVLETGADPVAEVWRRIEAAEVGDGMKELARQTPGAARIVERCLQANPRARYESGRDLLLDLRTQLQKTRGAHLQEFCDFYFETIQPIGSLETDEGRRRAPGRARGTPQRRPENMANDKPSRPKGPPRPGGPQRPSGPPRPGGPPRAGGGPSRPRASGPPGAGSRPPGPSSRPPSAAPTKPSAAPPPSARRDTSARAPDETGMLKMTALDGSDDVEPEHNKSATQFFALPASKKKKDPPPAPPVSGPAASGPGGRGLPGPSAANISMQPQASPMGGGGGMGISGPVAAGTTSPFQVGQQVSIGDDLGDESRARTYRVYFIVVGLFAMVGFVACLGLGGVWWQVNNKEEPVETVAVAPAPKTKTKPKADTGAPEALPPPPPPSPRPRPRPSGGSAPRPAPAPVAPAAPTVRDVMINIPSGVFFTGAEVTCASSGFRGRGAFSGTSAKVSNVPPGDCAIHFKGGAPAKGSVSGGASSYTCTFPSGVAVCN